MVKSARGMDLSSLSIYMRADTIFFLGLEIYKMWVDLPWFDLRFLGFPSAAVYYLKELCVEFFLKFGYVVVLHANHLVSDQHSGQV